MKKNLLIACSLLLAIVVSCSKTKSEVKDDTANKKYEAIVQELELKLSFSFDRTDPDNFQISLSDNFSIKQMSSKYVVEQNTEYFFINCINNLNGDNHLIYGIVNAENKVSITTLKAETDN